MMERAFLSSHDLYISLFFLSSLCKAELKNLIDISSSSFEFAKELIRHNLVNSLTIWHSLIYVWRVRVKRLLSDK